jgi:hypothetical protein
MYHQQLIPTISIALIALVSPTAFAQIQNATVDPAHSNKIQHVRAIGSRPDNRLPNRNSIAELTTNAVPVFTCESTKRLREIATHWSSNGRIPTSLGAFKLSGGGSCLYAAFYPSQEEWVYTLSHDGDRFMQRYRDRRTTGLKIKDLSVIVTNGVPYFTGLWAPSKGSPHGFYYGKTDSGFSEVWKKYIDGQGYRIDAHSSYFINGERFHAFSIIKDGQGFYFYYGLNAQQLGETAQQMNDKGFAPSKISSYGGNQPTYSVLFLKATKPYAWYYGMSVSGFLSRHRKYQEEGYQLINMSRSGDTMAAIWSK